MPLPSRGEPALTLTERSPRDMNQAMLCRPLKQMKVHVDALIGRLYRCIKQRPLKLWLRHARDQIPYRN